MEDLGHVYQAGDVGEIQGGQAGVKADIYLVYYMVVSYQSHVAHQSDSSNNLHTSRHCHRMYNDVFSRPFFLITATRNDIIYRVPIQNTIRSNRS